MGKIILVISHLRLLILWLFIEYIQWLGLLEELRKSFYTDKDLQVLFQKKTPSLLNSAHFLHKFWIKVWLMSTLGRVMIIFKIKWKFPLNFWNNVKLMMLLLMMAQLLNVIFQRSPLTYQLCMLRIQSTLKTWVDQFMWKLESAYQFKKLNMIKLLLSSNQTKLPI